MLRIYEMEGGKRVDREDYKKNREGTQYNGRTQKERENEKEMRVQREKMLHCTLSMQMDRRIRKK